MSRRRHSARHRRVRPDRRSAGGGVPPYADEQVFAISNIDPFAQASVLSRGLIAEHQGELWVASPLKKQHFRLYDGHCLEDDSRSVASFASRVVDGIVHVAA